ncbi:hypothetical protein HNQ51_003491 [Inhella inkyongensis]|uniref:Uncharacterized protein n=1 Tax=Inhella inkyongensis TaxID=392593 RepID=A0A840S9E1_9BURK|nr:hypothetical protein [Inhella inkyongensis]MBB5206148.1 hypothetical protein [Inhella inkyongensis]
MAALLRYCEQFAKQMLSDAGEFHPFGAFINSSGELEALGGYLGTEFPSGGELYTLLEGALASMVHERKARAYALAANVNMPAQVSSIFTDGVRVHIEAPGYSRLVYTPYRLLSYRAIRKFLAVVPTVEYAEPIAVDVPNKVFAAAEG